MIVMLTMIPMIILMTMMLHIMMTKGSWLFVRSSSDGLELVFCVEPLVTVDDIAVAALLQLLLQLMLLLLLLLFLLLLLLLLSPDYWCYDHCFFC